MYAIAARKATIKGKKSDIVLLLHLIAKMRIVILLVICSTFWTQNAAAQEIAPVKGSIEHLLLQQLNLESTELANLDVNQLKSFSDLWDKIKNSVTNAWNALKNIANKTKEKINVWMQDIKKRAEEVNKDFQAKLEALKDKLNKFKEAVKNTAGKVKQCIEQDQEAVHELLKQIAKRVTTCIAESVKKASVLDSYQSRLALDDTGFVKGAEDKIKKCVQKVDDSDECLNKARGEIYDDMEDTENSIMETRSTSRNLAEDALETILFCEADGVIKSSGAIIEEMLRITTCVMEQKENPPQ